VLKFFWGKYSLLYIHSEPSFVIGYLAVMFVVLVLFTIGWRTRVTAVVAMLLINSLYNRNAVYLEGHDTVFRCMWFMILFARTDEAWSVDNWIRRRREARLVASLAKVRSGAGARVPFDWGHWWDRAGHWLWGGLWGFWFCAIVEFDPRIVYMVVLAGLSLAAVVGIVEREHRRAQAEAGTLALPEQVRFRLIPGWPRYLFIAQLVCIYMATGLYKTGSVWKQGDALYYSLNMDHFYRFEVATQWVSVYLATNVFRLMTLVTLYWEKLFGLVVLGLILRWRHLHRDAPWYRAMEAVWWRMWLGRVALLGAYLACYRVVLLAYPWCLELQEDKSPTPPEPGLATIHTVFAIVLPALVLAWWLLGRWPIPIGKLFAGIANKIAPRRAARLEGATIDRELVRKSLFGRRIWLGIGVLFHGMLIATMNIGMFPVIMMWFYPAFFEAKPFLIAGRWLRDRLRRRKLTRLFAPKLLDDALSEGPGVLETSEQALRRDPTGPWWLDPWRLVVGAAALLRERDRSALRTTVERGRVRGGRIPDAVVLAVIGTAVLLVTLRGLEAKIETPDKTVILDPVAQKAEVEQRKKRLEQLGDAGHWWAYAGLGLAAISHFRRRPAQDQLPRDRAGSESGSNPVVLAEPQLIGGTLMRTIVLGFTIYHCAAIGVTFIPRYTVTQAWRVESTKTFGDYVSGTNLGQSWKMFAPNPPRANTFMRTVIVDTEGSSFQVGKDHYSERPYVFWYNDRERKMHRRMIGKSKWYLRYWGEYHCRDWALNNDGVLPKEVRMYKLKTAIPPPDVLAESGKPSNPRERKLQTELVETHTCDADVVTPEMKQRRGWSLTDEDYAQLDADAKQSELTADAKRKQWGARKDFGGDAEAQQGIAPLNATPEGDDE
jgi:hypothetical protein